ncbi:hypothetical protein [Streptomyces sp. AS02]|uniref:hypothetical protein n=1 Tax=Streptomyces sp. AS02 TaxID=2938946 RepID=UPI0020206832|nr:hypothetical protein [Streptomyces sp. AS02]MCL8016471.1 hypothetical protein [Streptomyces sp. AS02]
MSKAEDTPLSGGGYGGVPDDALFVSGIDLVSPWRDASAVADELNARLEALGADVRVVRAVPHVNGRGEPELRLRLEGARVVVRALRRAGRMRADGVAALERMVDEREGELGHEAA